MTLPEAVAGAALCFRRDISIHLDDIITPQSVFLRVEVGEEQLVSRFDSQVNGKTSMLQTATDSSRSSLFSGSSGRGCHVRSARSSSSYSSSARPSSGTSTRSESQPCRKRERAQRRS